MGDENIFIFGLRTPEATELKTHYTAEKFANENPAIKEALDMISSAYSRIVLSEENLPDFATLRMAFFVHSAGFLYSSDTFFCACAYEPRSARCR
ncbi:MAG: glycogen/starch/alpha-glucan phosphorylase [Spirochaetales bacterium]|nr:glycogen/starch/alpha-glucan phosphorylase [Spirochaetales bacterium]